MIAFFACLGALILVVGALFFLVIRPLQRQVATLDRNFGAHAVWSAGQNKLRRDEVRALRNLSGEEIEAVSERLDKIETRPTVMT